MTSRYVHRHHVKVCENCAAFRTEDISSTDGVCARRAIGSDGFPETNCEEWCLEWVEITKDHRNSIANRRFALESYLKEHKDNQDECQREECEWFVSDHLRFLDGLGIAIQESDEEEFKELGVDITTVRAAMAEEDRLYDSIDSVDEP